MYRTLSIWLLMLLVFGCAEQVSLKKESSNLCIQDRCIDLEVVDTPEWRQKGLMFREYLPEWSGMLFVFDKEGYYPFWMKNTLIPLDILRLDSDYRVVDVQTAVPCRADPCKEYYPAQDARYVLELNAWRAEQLAIEIWTILELQ